MLNDERWMISDSIDKAATVGRGAGRVGVEFQRARVINHERWNQ